MRQHNDTKSELLDFIDKKALDPVLEAIPEQYSSERDRRLLKEVQKRAALEKESFHHKDLTASQIRKKYLREIYYEVHNRIGKELEDLELPRFIQLRAQFLQLCTDLNVN